jgi:hypothetical protein
MDESPSERIPSYLGAMALFGGLWAAVAGLATRSGVDVRYSLPDVVAGGFATHKFARIVSKSGVATPLRAPFTQYEGEAGSGEVNERPRDKHPQHTVGELLSCPFCLAPWMATGYIGGLVLAPRVARTWAAAFSVVALSDFLQFAYVRVRTE